jgi:signal transduction histidine kinase
MMAHEVNNSIGAINSILESVTELYRSENKEEEQEVKEALNIAIQRNQGLNQFMKNFASVVRLPEPHKENIALNSFVKDIARLMEAQAKEKGASLQLILSDKNPSIQADRRQMEQALVNIIKNAVEALDESPGLIRITVQDNPLALVVEDNGRGISPEHAEKLFSPFFSTKADGQGIGLTLVREILINHGARFSLKTGKEGWTAFRIEMA